MKGNEGCSCTICLEPWTNTGYHRLCCLKCGHLYGKSCIVRWVKQQALSTVLQQVQINCRAIICCGRLLHNSRSTLTSFQLPVCWFQEPKSVASCSTRLLQYMCWASSQPASLVMFMEQYFVVCRARIGDIRNLYVSKLMAADNAEAKSLRRQVQAVEWASNTAQVHAAALVTEVKRLSASCKASLA